MVDERNYADQEDMLVEDTVGIKQEIARYEEMIAEQVNEETKAEISDLDSLID